MKHVRERFTRCYDKEINKEAREKEIMTDSSLFTGLEGKVSLIIKGK